MRRPLRKPTIRLPCVFPICGALVLALALTTATVAEQLPPAQAALCIHLQHQLQRLDVYDARVATARRLIEETD